MKIIESNRLTKNVSHTARVTLDDGRILEIRECDFGYRDYPHVGRELSIDAVNNLAIVSDPNERGGWDHDPMQGRPFSFVVVNQ